MCCQKAFPASVTSGGWPTGGEALRFSSAALCSLNNLHLRPLPQPLTEQFLRNGNALIALDRGAKPSGSLTRKSCSKGRWRYLTVPNSHSVRLYALLVPVCRVDLRSGSFILFLPPSPNVILPTGSDPFRPAGPQRRPFYCGHLPLPQAIFAIENP
jgi:hypothetical protein